MLEHIVCETLASSLIGLDGDVYVTCLAVDLRLGTDIFPHARSTSPIPPATNFKSTFLPLAMTDLF